MPADYLPCRDLHLFDRSLFSKLVASAQGNLAELMKIIAVGTGNITQIQWSWCAATLLIALSYQDHLWRTTLLKRSPTKTHIRANLSQFYTKGPLKFKELAWEVRNRYIEKNSNDCSKYFQSSIQRRVQKLVFKAADNDLEKNVLVPTSGNAFSLIKVLSSFPGDCHLMNLPNYRSSFGLTSLMTSVGVM